MERVRIKTRQHDPTMLSWTFLQGEALTMTDWFVLFFRRYELSLLRVTPLALPLASSAHPLLVLPSLPHSCKFRYVDPFRVA